jgi:hypothetical protein|tara:strand:+ start:155 stop:343 length:189 start_codon:yes stop_codon:yes gene_type:complete
MKKGRKYIEPMTGRGDDTVKKRNVKKLRREAGRTFDGVSRPSNDQYREEWNRIFKKEEENNE